MNTRLPHAFEAADLSRAIGVTQAIYSANAFSSMKVGWDVSKSAGTHDIDRLLQVP